MKTLICLILSLPILMPLDSFSGVFSESNYWECILDEMPGVKNDPAAIEVKKKCRKKHPNPYERFTIEKKSPLFGVKTAGECKIKYGKDVSSPENAESIKYACYRLYRR